MKVFLCFEGRSSSYLLAWCCCYQTSSEYEHTKHQNWVEFHWWRYRQSQRRHRWSSPSLPLDNNVDETWQTLDWNLSELKEEENYFYVSHQQRMWDVSRNKTRTQICRDPDINTTDNFEFFLYKWKIFSFACSKFARSLNY